MAFKVLSKEEKSLLTVEQLKQYEKELDIHMQRIAFIEKLSKLEKADIKQYKPDLKSIDIIGEFEYTPFISYKKHTLDFKPMPKTELPCSLSSKGDKKLNVSEFIKSNTMHKKHIDFNHEFFPKTDNFRIYEPKRHTVPAFSDLVIPNLTFAKLENVLFESIQAKKVSASNVRSFTAPEKTALELAKVSKPKNRTRNFIKTDATKLDISVDVKSDIVVKPFEKSEFIMTVFPETTKVDVDLPAFQLPEKSSPQIPIDAKININIGSFVMPENLISGLPQILMPVVEINSFQTPVQPKLDIVFNTVSNVEVKSFEKIVFEAVGLPVIRNPYINQVKFHTPEKQQLNLSSAVKTRINIKSFKKPQAIKPKLNTEVNVYKPKTNFRKPILSRPELPAINICRGIKTVVEAQDILFMLNKESVL